MRLNNREKESSFAPLNNPHDRLPCKPNSGGGLSRDRKAKIASMLRDLTTYERCDGVMCECIEQIIKEVEK